MVLPIVAAEGLEGSIGVQGEAAPSFTTIMPVTRYLLARSAMSSQALAGRKTTCDGWGLFHELHKISGSRWAIYRHG